MDHIKWGSSADLIVDADRIAVREQAVADARACYKQCQSLVAAGKLMEGLAEQTKLLLVQAEIDLG